MKKLIEALNILLKYGNPDYPFHCEHDQLNVVGINPEDISKEDKEKLDELGFIVQVDGEYDEDNEDYHEESSIYSFRYGSA